MVALASYHSYLATISLPPASGGVTRIEATVDSVSVTVTDQPQKL